eukprot:TRINITY_DN46207_c0_g1_i1.p1 TRINITY_DN46207_c0_g1~~TRINITY_DN46207_c0_g1_i1.p1  ORF type:complete len:108 (+),score=10.00 TRINITY_DN46207_c0_g1_i1:50-373(+)
MNICMSVSGSSHLSQAQVVHSSAVHVLTVVLTCRVAENLSKLACGARRLVQALRSGSDSQVRSSQGCRPCGSAIAQRLMFCSSRAVRYVSVCVRSWWDVFFASERVR